MSTFFGYSNEELASLSEAELDELNARMDFVRRAMPDGWLDLADELHEAAEMLWTVSDRKLRLESQCIGRVDPSGTAYEILHQTFVGFSRTYFLLAGFAIENLTKGLLVASDPGLVNGGKLSKELTSHRLMKLLESLDIPDLASQEIRFATAAERAIPYWGRYPVPVKKERVGQEEPLTEEQRAGYLSLRGRLRDALEGAIAKGWDSGVGARIAPSHGIFGRSD